MSTIKFVPMWWWEGIAFFRWLFKLSRYYSDGLDWNRSGVVYTLLLAACWLAEISFSDFKHYRCTHAYTTFGAHSHKQLLYTVCVMTWKIWVCVWKLNGVCSSSQDFCCPYPLTISDHPRLKRFFSIVTLVRRDHVTNTHSSWKSFARLSKKGARSRRSGSQT